MTENEGQIVTEREEQRRREWLAKVAEHPETDEADYVAAEAYVRGTTLADGQAPDLTNLIRLGIVIPSQEWVAVLRCQAWNTWPESNFAEKRIRIGLSDGTELRARLAVLSYVQPSAPERYVIEETNVGPLLWDGETPGLHHVRSVILKAPEDVIEIGFQHRHARRGEVDICINFKYDEEPDGELPKRVVESLRAIAYSTMSLINLKLGDYLTPAAPFQIREVLSGGQGQLNSTITIAVKNRHAVEQKTVEDTLAEIADIHRGSKYGEKLTIALELYAAHFNEQQIRVRFILLVIAMEALAETRKKHPAAVALVDKWRKEIEDEKAKYDRRKPREEALRSLNSLAGSLKWLRDESIGNQIANLFEELPDVDVEEIARLKKRASDLYNKRSTLVHTGKVSISELPGLEKEARELLEILFTAVIEQSRNNPGDLLESTSEGDSRDHRGPEPDEAEVASAGYRASRNDRCSLRRRRGRSPR